MSRTSLISPSFAVFALLAACSVAPGGELGMSGDSIGTGSRDNGDDEPGDSEGDGNDGLEPIPDIGSIPGAEVCGDGVLTTEEACDDGNTMDGDGCSADCKVVAEGYSCNPPGQPCRNISLCGDGLVTFPELCDDGNRDEGDGCSDLCKVEVGFKCEGLPTSTCVPTVCGDGVQEGAESCDDGNANPGDGCNERCQQEPSCPASGACTSECGDGLVLNEGCDDGNLIDGDGCSSTCEIEAGFTCEQGDACEMVGDQCVLQVYATYRDFTVAHNDFFPASNPARCDQATATTGMVNPMLNDAGKPTIANLTCSSEADFATWYTDAPGVNTTHSGSIVLYPNESGGYVNRFGPNGEQFLAYEDVWAAPDLATCEAMDLDCVLCDFNTDGQPDGTTACTRMILAQHDGTPLFFPLDDVGSELEPAKIPAEYGFPSWPWEEQVLGEEVLHNFHFTSEIAYWFTYDPAAPATLEFTGDDDVWVFVNGILAVDLGGIHVPLSGSVTIDETTAGNFGLEPGNSYRVKIFHAERKPEGSSFQLTLTGFNTSRSECRPECGDGIVGLGEECDDGVNDGGYGECGEGCRLDQYCGDGIVQEDQGENCDDGNFIDNDECPASCRIVIVG